MIARLSVFALALGAGFVLSGCASPGGPGGYYDPYPYRSDIYYYDNYYYGRPPPPGPPGRPPPARPPVKPPPVHPPVRPPVRPTPLPAITR